MYLGLLLVVSACSAALSVPSARPVLTTLYYFANDSFANPQLSSNSALIEARNGNLYGICRNDGAADQGFLFTMTRDGAVSPLHSFGDGSVLNDGVKPCPELVQGSDGNFYGTTHEGGSAGQGTVFMATPAGKITILHSFADGTVPNDGAQPEFGLVQGPDADLYGVTSEGGYLAARDTNGLGGGVVFRIAPTGAMKIMHCFGDGAVKNDGVRPAARLIVGPQGGFWGVTSSGGLSYPNNWGTVFRMDRTGKMAIVHCFAPYGGTSVAVQRGAAAVTYGAPRSDLPRVLGQPSFMDGMDPNSLAIAPGDGIIGTTQQGGIAGKGMVFRITAQGKFTILHSFGARTSRDGQCPVGGLVLASDGDFYGVTYSGGTDGQGTIFRINRRLGESVVHAFVYSTAGLDGTMPVSLMLSRGGEFYGTTRMGPSTNVGTIFRFTFAFHR